MEGGRKKERKKERKENEMKQNFIRMCTHDLRLEVSAKVPQAQTPWQ